MQNSQKVSQNDVTVFYCSKGIVWIKNTNIKTKIFKKDNKFRIRAFHTAIPKNLNSLLKGLYLTKQ